MLIKIICLSIISGVLYRLGGWEKGNTKIRDLGIPLITLLSLFVLGINGLWWKVGISYFLTFGLMFGALTTYWDKLFGEDNFYAHGFGIGLATLPLMLIGIHWYIVLIYAVSLSILMGLWSMMIKWDVLEEFGRGFLICLLLLIFKVR